MFLGVFRRCLCRRFSIGMKKPTSEQCFDIEAEGEGFNSIFLFNHRLSVCGFFQISGIV